MARRRMTMVAWAKALHDHEDTLRFGDYQGSSPGGAADRLGVTRQYIHKLVDQGQLDLLELYLGDDKKKRTVAWLVTSNSIERWAAARMSEQTELLSSN
jgi:hypothetical protein